MGGWVPLDSLDDWGWLIWIWERDVLVWGGEGCFFRYAISKRVNFSIFLILYIVAMLI